LRCWLPGAALREWTAGNAKSRSCHSSQSQQEQGSGLQLLVRYCAKKLAERFCGTAADEETERIFKYLQDVSGPDGTFHYYGKWIYGWVLWDVRKCSPHSYSV
jgi:hypothetical protein